MPRYYFALSAVAGREKANSLEDNYFSLLPGEKREVKATYKAKDLAGTAPVVQVDGWNIKAKLMQFHGKEKMPDSMRERRKHNIAGRLGGGGTRNLVTVLERAGNESTIREIETLANHSGAAIGPVRGAITGVGKASFQQFQPLAIDSFDPLVAELG
jgi:hypothetical protein